MFETGFGFFETNFVPKCFFGHFVLGDTGRPKHLCRGGVTFQYKEALVRERPVFSIIWCFAQISLKNPIEIVYGSVVLMLLFGFCPVLWPVPWVVPWTVSCVVPWAVPWALFCAGLCVVPWAVPWAVSCIVSWVVPCIVSWVVSWLVVV